MAGREGATSLWSTSEGIYSGLVQSMYLNAREGWECLRSASSICGSVQKKTDSCTPRLLYSGAATQYVGTTEFHFRNIPDPNNMVYISTLMFLHLQQFLAVYVLETCLSKQLLLSVWWTCDYIFQQYLNTFSWDRCFYWSISLESFLKNDEILLSLSIYMGIAFWHNFHFYVFSNFLLITNAFR